MAFCRLQWKGENNATRLWEVEKGWIAVGSLKLTRARTASTSGISGNGAGNTCGMVHKIGISEGQHMSALIGTLLQHLQVLCVLTFLTLERCIFETHMNSVGLGAGRDIRPTANSDHQGTGKAREGKGSDLGLTARSRQ